MKKLIFSLSALAALLLAGSCQRENLEPVQQGGTVTYTVQVPGALATKTATENYELIYQVYRETQVGSETAEPIYKGTETFSGNSVNLPLEFVKGQNFVVLFWAQKVGLTAYNTGNLRNVTLNSGLTANQENYEVFAGMDEVSNCESSNNGNVKLVRPIAQLNIATDAEGLKLGNTDVYLISSFVTVKGLSTTYNVYNKAVSETLSDVQFSVAAVPDGKLGTTDYTYVAMNYIGFIDANGTTVDVDFTVKTSEGDIAHSVSSVPVKPNYKTNIIGNLITATDNYKVTLGAWGDGETNVEVVAVSTAQELQEAINEIQNGAEGNIILEGNIDLGALAGLISTKADEPVAPTYGLLIPAGKTLVLDLNGNTLAQTVSQTGAYSMIQNNGNLTIIDSKGTGKIAYGDTGNGGNYVSNTIGNSGTLVIESGLIENNSSATVAANGYPHPIDNSGELIINGGTLTNNAHYSSMRIWCTTDDDTSVTINGGTFNGSIDYQTPNSAPNKGSLIINGGTFNADTYTKCAVRLLGFGADVDEMLGYINGGTFNGEIALKNWAGAEFNSQVFYITGGQFSVDPSAFVVDGYPVEAPETEDGYFTIGEYTTVAKIGDQEYGSLRAAVAAVEEGGTITLIANETFTKANRYNNGGYWDGLGYSGDKSFTIDLGGYTISQDGALNDYLVWIKNVGSKENTITFKNGTMDAGKTAYCALCTASSHENKLTVNLEDITLINDNSNGSTVKIRTGSELNVKAGTKIIGKNSYLGIENWKADVNIYDGAEIYMNGTASYNGCLVGVGGNGTVNVYGGYGKGVSGGLIAMTSGGTINAMGGEWIANTDGTFANSNKSVLVAQSDKQYNAGAGNAVVNVTGGTYKGGYNCYGNAVGDAQINIKGGNFNANPETYVVKGYVAKEENGIYVVSKKPEATVNGTSYGTLAEAVAAAKAGETVTVIDDVTLSSELALPAGIIFNGNGKQINGSIYACAEGNLTFAGHTKVTSFSASYYNRTITIGEGACLEVTGGGRVSLAYGNTFNITGSIKNAKTADKANVQPSLIIPGGISITGGNDAAMNVTNAYVKIGSTTSKPGVANGKFALNFNNSIAEFTNEFGFYEPTGGKNPTFEMSITNSVFTTGAKLCVAAANSTITVNNSNVLLGTYLRNSGELNITNGSVLTGKTIQFGENGGNNGTIKVDASTLTIVAGSTGQAFDGKGIGSISATNGATVKVDYYKAMTINTDATSTFEGTEVQ